MSQHLADELSNEFTKLTGIECKATFIKKGKRHKPTKLSKKQKGVYAFLLNEDVCFKVGKANSKSQARWNSHHYNLDKTTSSTLIKSILSHLKILKKYFDKEDIDRFKSILKKYKISQKSLKEDLKKLDKKKIKKLSDELSMKDWIQNNINRMEFLIENKDDDVDYDTNLLEALIQFKLKPIFEGKNA